MYKPTPVICPCCGKDTGFYYEDFTHMVIFHDILCPHCQYAVIKANNVMWKHINERENTPYLTNQPDLKYQVT